MDSSRQVAGLLVSGESADASLVSIKVKRCGEVEEPDLTGVLGDASRVERVKITVRTTFDVAQDGDIICHQGSDSWDVYIYHRIRFHQEPEKYVVYYCVSRSFGLVGDIVVFRQALNRLGLVFAPVRWREDKFGLTVLYYEYST